MFWLIIAGFLLESGFPEAYARFARTHAQWDRGASVHLEDVLVAFADTIWKGQRDEVLERELAQQIVRITLMWSFLMQVVSLRLFSLAVSFVYEYSREITRREPQHEYFDLSFCWGQEVDQAECPYSLGIIRCCRGSNFPVEGTWGSGMVLKVLPWSATIKGSS